MCWLQVRLPKKVRARSLRTLRALWPRGTRRRRCCWRGISDGPRLAQQFGLGKLPGLSELLQGEPAPAMNIYQLEGLGFWILPAGSPLKNPMELLQSGRLSLLMDQLAGWFDWIVIDSPPVLPLADTSIWMRLADGVLLVTRPGKTSKRQLQRGLEGVEQPKAARRSRQWFQRCDCQATTTIITMLATNLFPGSRPADKMIRWNQASYLP